MRARRARELFAKVSCKSFCFTACLLNDLEWLTPQWSRIHISTKKCVCLWKQTPILALDKCPFGQNMSPKVRCESRSMSSSSRPREATSAMRRREMGSRETERERRVRWRERAIDGHSASEQSVGRLWNALWKPNTGQYCMIAPNCKNVIFIRFPLHPNSANKVS